MDSNRYEEIEGLEALKTLAKEEAIYRNNWMWKVVDGRLKSKNIDSKNWSYSRKDINDLICPSDEDESNYFVKKLFDIRKEMLARPDEWVGGFKLDGRWVKVGFCSKRMTPVFSLYNSLQPTLIASVLRIHSLLDTSIPIEDILKENLQ